MPRGDFDRHLKHNGLPELRVWEPGSLLSIDKTFRQARGPQE